MFISFIKGLLGLTIFFAISLIITFGVKSLFHTLKSYVQLSFRKTAPVKPTPIKQTVKKPKKKTTRTIYVNPDQVDRIYVKKSS